MKQKIIWQIYLFSKGNYFLKITSILNFSLSALQGLVYKKATKQKPNKKETSRCNLIIHNHEGLNFS